jgi:tetratricopeptide (TPR) repeat protein
MDMAADGGRECRAALVRGQGRLDEARQLYDRVLVAAPAHVPTLHGLAVLHHDQAIPPAQRALLCDLRLCSTRLCSCQPPRPASPWPTAWRRSPGAAAAHGRALCLAPQGHAADAQALYERALAAGPGDVLVLTDLAKLHREHARRARAGGRRCHRAPPRSVLPRGSLRALRSAKHGWDLGAAKTNKSNARKLKKKAMGAGRRQSRMTMPPSSRHAEAQGLYERALAVGLAWGALPLRTTVHPLHNQVLRRDSAPPFLNQSTVRAAQT